MDRREALKSGGLEGLTYLQSFEEIKGQIYQGKIAKSLKFHLAKLEGVLEEILGQFEEKISLEKLEKSEICRGGWGGCHVPYTLGRYDYPS